MFQWTRCRRGYGNKRLEAVILPNSPMKIDLSIEIRPGYLFVTLSGKFDNQALLRGISPIIDTAGKTGSRKVLIDARRVKGEMDLEERMLLAEQWAASCGEFEVATGVRLRTVLVANPPILDPRRRGQQHARDRGADLIGVYDILDAYRWLDFERPPVPVSA